VKPDDSSVGDGPGRFRTTQWSAVLLSAQSQAPGSRAALSDLCKLYWYPLYAFIRRRGCSAEDAQDLTQGFFLSLIDRKALRQVTPLKGKFRSFLLASLRNYLSDQFDRGRSQKRGGNIEFVPLDFESGDERYRSEPHDTLTAEKIFDARWAMTLLDETLRRLRQEYVAQQKLTVFKLASFSAVIPFSLLNQGYSRSALRASSKTEVWRISRLFLVKVLRMIERTRLSSVSSVSTSCRLSAASRTQLENGSPMTSAI
jgi:DNA-directed RNA polymerase specialized sigma24 family protein